MRETLLVIAMLLSNLAYSQVNGFWDLMPDSLREQRYLKNWKLNGPVKQVVVKDFSGLYSTSYDLDNTTQSTWDTLTAGYLSSKEWGRWDKTLAYDTVRFKPDGELVYLFYENSERNSFNYFNGDYQIIYTSTGYPKYIISEDDTLEYQFDTQGRLIAEKQYDKHFVQELGYVWQYPDDHTKVMLMQYPGFRHLIKEKSYHYNTKGLIVKEREYDESLEFGWDEEAYVPLDSGIVETFYEYDENDNLITFKRVEPTHVRIPSENNIDSDYYADSIVSYIDSSVYRYTYNTAGQVIEVRGSSYSGIPDLLSSFYGSAIEPSDILQKWVSKREYDKNGSLVKESIYSIDLKTGKQTLSTTSTFVYVYDRYNNPIRIMYIDGNVSYDGQWEEELDFVQFVEYVYY